MAIICENALVVTLDPRRPVLQDQQILIDQGIIAEIGKRVRAGEKGTGYFFVVMSTDRMLEALRAENSTRTTGRLRLPRH